MSEDNLSPKYFEGKPCKKCGSTKRYASNKHCVDCAFNQARKWQQENSEKVLKANRKWRRANLEKAREIVRKWQQANPEKVQRWYQQNSEKANKQSRKWQQANPEKNRENHLKWLKANPEKVREQNHKRDLKRRENNCERYREIHRVALEKSRAKRNQAEGYYTTQDWIDLKEQYDNHCLCCKKHKSEFSINPRTGRPYAMEQDHIIPLSVCQWCSKNYKVCRCPNQKLGTNWISNIQPLCHDCNGMGGKGTKIIDYRRDINKQR
jgi:hypothetical protein